MLCTKLEPGNIYSSTSWIRTLFEATALFREANPLPASVQKLVGRKTGTRIHELATVRDRARHFIRVRRCGIKRGTSKLARGNTRVSAKSSRGEEGSEPTDSSQRIFPLPAMQPRGAGTSLIDPHDHHPEAYPSTKSWSRRRRNVPFALLVIVS